MNFLGIGAMEFFVILIAALLIFGPGRLPELMGDAGRMLRDFRRATRDLTGDFEDSYREVRQTYDEIETDMKRTARELREESEEIARSVEDVASDAIPTEEPNRQRSRATRAKRPTSAAKLDQADPVEIDAVEIEDDTLQAEQPAPLSDENTSTTRATNRPKKRAPSSSAASRKPKPTPAPADDDLLSLEADDEEDLLSQSPDSEIESDESRDPHSED